MSRRRRTFSAEFKAPVGLEVLKGFEPVHAIAAKDQSRPVQAGQWKKVVAERLLEGSAKKRATEATESAEREKELFEEIGQLNMELESLR